MLCIIIPEEPSADISTTVQAAIGIDDFASTSASLKCAAEAGVLVYFILVGNFSPKQVGKLMAQLPQREFPNVKIVPAEAVANR